MRTIGYKLPQDAINPAHGSLSSQKIKVLERNRILEMKREACLTGESFHRDCLYVTGILHLLYRRQIEKMKVMKDRKGSWDHWLETAAGRY